MKLLKKISLIICAVLILNLCTGCGSDDSDSGGKSKVETYKEKGITIDEFLTAYNSFAKKEFYLAPFEGKYHLYNKYDKIYEAFNDKKQLGTAWLPATIFERLEINFYYHEGYHNGNEWVKPPILNSISIMVTDTDGSQSSSYAKQYQLLVYSYIVKAVQKITGLNCAPVMEKINQYSKYAENDDIEFYSVSGGKIVVDDISFRVGDICGVTFPTIDFSQKIEEQKQAEVLPAQKANLELAKNVEVSKPVMPPVQTQRNEIPVATPPKSDPVLIHSVGGVHLGDSLAQMRQSLGNEQNIKGSSNIKDYVYNDVTITARDNTIIGLVTYTTAVATEKGIRQGDSLNKVLQSYGGFYSLQNYADWQLYEYVNDNSQKGEAEVLRFAVKNNEVDYISLRYVDGQDRAEILSYLRQH